MGLDMYLYRMTKGQKKRYDDHYKAYAIHCNKWEQIEKQFPRIEGSWELDESRMTEEQKQLKKKLHEEYEVLSIELSEIEASIRETYHIENTYGCEYGYWRKFNALHGFICDRFANGVDKCQMIELTEDNLREILSKLNETSDFLDSNMDDGVFIGDLDDCPMKPKSGFFFGSTMIDEWFQKDVDDAVGFFSRLLETFDPENEVCVYQASW